MSVLRRVKLRTPDGTESIEYPLGVEAKNVEVANQENLSQRLVRIDEDLEKNEEDIAAVSELAGTNKQNIGANEIRIDALERRSASVDKKPYYFDTVADMKAYQELKVGDMAVTLGYYSVNDGGGCIYKITDTAPTSLSNVTNNNALDNFYLTLNNGLYAIPYNDINNDYYDEITMETETHNNTTCYFTTIPLNDNDNNEIELYVKNNSGMNISDYARIHKTTISINATLGVNNPETGTNDNASVISNGEIIRTFINPPAFLEDHYKFIGIKQNREFVDFQANITTAEQMIAQGVKEAWLCFGKLVDNGVITDYAQDINDDIMKNYYPRQAIGVTLDKTVIILTCDGRTVQDRGLTGVETAQLLIEKGCVNVWNLDGGGSTNTVYKGSRINKYIDDNGLKERHIVYCLNAKKKTTNKNIDNSFNNIGIEKERIIKQLLPTIPRMLIKSPANCNELITGTNMYSCFNSTNKPENAPAYGYLLVIPIASINNSIYGNACRQIWLNRENNQIWTRAYVYGTWTDWKEIGTMFDTELTAVANQSLGIGTNYPVMQLNNNVADYMRTYITLENNQIKTTRNASVLISAVFTVKCELDGLMTIRLRKNGTNNVAGITFTGIAGQLYNVVLQKMQTFSTTDYFEFTSNGGTNKGGVNQIVSANINIMQNA